jgi:predicted Zn finger-like uncharacterized protein
MTNVAVVVCPHCSTQLRIKDPRWLNKQMRCPKCSKIFMGKPAAEASGADTAEDEFGPAVQPLASGKAPLAPPPAEAEEQPSPKKKKRRRKKGDGTVQNSLRKMCGYGFAGGSIACVIWIGVALLTGDVFGFLACLVGVCAGIGVETGMATSEDSRAGEMAAIITVLLDVACRCLLALFLTGAISEAALFNSTSRYDILWFVISAVIAYVIGAGLLFD